MNVLADSVKETHSSTPEYL